MGSVVVLWLTPSEPACTFFRAAIGRLAAAHDGPIFEPHLTLGLGSVAQLEQVNAAAIELPIIGLDSTVKFTKTLFVRFQFAPALAALRKSLGMDAPGFDPHLSLLYREIPETTKRELVASISLSFATVSFTSIRAVRCPPETSTAADVEAWEIIATKALA
ncbi:MAG TPA: hypothetical protein VHW03_00900 [Chthoniobacterales bacterium]|nr:hypothetical protein [Chthoniobacterales bacterium]